MGCHTINSYSVSTAQPTTKRGKDDFLTEGINPRKNSKVVYQIQPPNSIKNIKSLKESHGKTEMI